MKCQRFELGIVLYKDMYSYTLTEQVEKHQPDLVKSKIIKKSLKIPKR